MEQLKTVYSLDGLDEKNVVQGNLDLRGTGITELPENLTVSGFLDLSETKITELPNGLTVGGFLDLRDIPITELPEDLAVGGSIDLKGTGITKLPNSLIVGGSLDLRRTGITELPDNLTVGDDLYLTGTGITKLPDNLTVGGTLDFRRTSITELPESLTVGRFIKGLDTSDQIISRLIEGDYIPGKYIFADRILTHVKAKKRFRNYDFYVGKIPGRNVITDGVYYAHCRNIRDGIRDLQFKRAKDRGVRQYRRIGLDDVIPTDELVTMYRAITGACQQGTEEFLFSLGELKTEYTIREAIELTKGQYGAITFRAFFVG